MDGSNLLTPPTLVPHIHTTVTQPRSENTVQTETIKITSRFGVRSKKGSFLSTQSWGCLRGCSQHREAEISVGWYKWEIERFRETPGSTNSLVAQLSFYQSRWHQSIQVPSAFWKLELHHFALVRDLHEYLSSLMERNPKGIFIFMKKGKRGE